MNSRERVLAASAGRQPDRVPILLYTFHTGSKRPAPWPWHTAAQKAETLLGLGADEVLSVGAPQSFARDVEYVSWREATPAGPRLIGEIRTPRGVLRQEVRETEDWPHGEHVPLFSDFGVARASKWWVENERDLEVLSSLLAPPSVEEVASARVHHREVRAAADRLGLAVEGGTTMAGDAAAWLMGFEGLMLAAAERPEFVRELLAIIDRWDKQRLQVVLDSDVDIIRRRAWYESADLWSPRLYRDLLAPLTRAEVDLVHGAGKLHSYIMTTGIMPLLADIRATGTDVLWGVDPEQGDADLRRVKQELAGRVQTWGGVNGALTIGHGTREEIRAAVKEACEVLGAGGGFALFPVDAVFEDCPWENVLTFIEAGREFGAY